MADNSTQERLKGKTNEIVGGAKEKLGDAINNEEMESSGQTQQIKGKTQGLHADAKDTVLDPVDR